MRHRPVAALAAMLALACTPTPPESSVGPTCTVSGLRLFDANDVELVATSTIQVRQQFPVKATFSPTADCSPSEMAPEWSSSAPASAAISSASVVSTGVLSAVVSGVSPTGAPGFTSISVRVMSLTRSAFFTVVPGPLHHITIAPADPTVVAGSTRQLTVEFRDQDGFLRADAGGAVVWSTPPNPVATVSPSGLVTAVSEGSATITATYTGATPNLVATTSVTVTAVPVASIVVSPATSSIAIGGTTPLTATVKDAGGNVLTGRGVNWQSLNTAIATTSAAAGSGTVTVTGVAAGVVTIRAVSAESATIFGDAQVTVTGPPPPAPVLLAYAVADQPSTAAYTPDPASQFNGQGGAITATRSGPGQYTVTIPGFGGGAGESRLPLVNAVNAAGVVCLAVSWTMIGVSDATIRVDCSTAGGALTDSRFAILAVGQGSFPGRFAFANSGALPAGAAPVNLPTAAAWSSSGLPPQLTRDAINTVGRFQLGLRLPADGSIDVPVVQPAGATAARCQVSSWGPSQDVVCFAAGSAGQPFVDAQFSGMFVNAGRAGKRFGAVHSSLAGVSRSSAGGGNSVTALGGGAYRATFANLGRTAGARETVLVTAHGLLSAVVCNPSGWSTVGSDLVVDVFCFGGSGAGAPGQDFVVVVIE